MTQKLSVVGHRTAFNNEQNPSVLLMKLPITKHKLDHFKNGKFINARLHLFNFFFYRIVYYSITCFFEKVIVKIDKTYFLSMGISLSLLLYTIFQEKQQKLKAKVQQLDKHISSIQKESVGHLQARLKEVCNYTQPAIHSGILSKNKMCYDCL